MAPEDGRAFTEEQVIELLAEVFAAYDARVLLGIGDDAALVVGAPQQVLTTDIAVEGVHFRSEWSSAFDIGKRIAAANIADVLSMNGQCEYLLVTATLTGNESLDWIRNLARGIADQAREAGAVVVGGDLARSQTLSISITAVGRTDHVIKREGAQVGDSIYLSSLTGWSAAGLEILARNLNLSGDAAQKALNEYRAPSLDFEVDFSGATSMSDVSDALLIQGRQMAKASQVKFKIDGTLITQSDEFRELEKLAKEAGADMWSWILQGGEDHVLLATGRNLPGLLIGEVVEGAGIIAEMDGVEIKMAPVSWSHF